jgi:hypothetical protein
MLQLLIKRIAAWLAGITPEQWKFALSLVKEAEALIRLKTGTERRQYVLDRLRNFDPNLSNNALNLLIELAVAFIRK